MNRIKKTIYYSSLIITLVTVSISCAQPSEEKENVFPNRVSFVIGPKSLQMELPVHFNDSITANLVFDTGGTALTLDSSFCTTHPAIMLPSPDAIQPTGSGWSNNLSTSASIYNSAAMAVRVGETNLLFDKIKVYDWKRFRRDNGSDGLFNIPNSDTTHIWELNFEHNYLDIHSDSNFVMPENCLTFPLTQDQSSRTFFNIPLKMTFSDGDTLTLNRKFMIDTGILWDVVLISRAPEFNSFYCRKDAIWVLDWHYTRRIIAHGTLSSQIQLDSLRIHTVDFPNGVPCDYLVGLNFLKRFNAFFDLKNRQLGLQPINYFQRIVDISSQRFHMATNINKQGKLIITKIADYDENYCKKAGLKEGDEIIAINGKDVRKCTVEERKEILLQDTLVYDVIRGGVQLNIKVIVDRSETFED